MIRKITMVLLAIVMLSTLPFALMYGFFGFAAWSVVVLMAHFATKDK